MPLTRLVQLCGGKNLFSFFQYRALIKPNKKEFQKIINPKNSECIQTIVYLLNTFVSINRKHIIFR